MRLSDAMRVGSARHPQGFGRFVIYGASGYDEVVSTCAMGAACEAVEPEHVRTFGDVIDRHWRALVATPAECPVCHIRVTVCAVIVDLNDGHRWTREAIAEWLEPLERAFEAEQQENIYATV